MDDTKVRASRPDEVEHDLEQSPIPRPRVAARFSTAFVGAALAALGALLLISGLFGGHLIRLHEADSAALVGAPWWLDGSPTATAGRAILGGLFLAWGTILLVIYGVASFTVRTRRVIVAPPARPVTLSRPAYDEAKRRIRMSPDQAIVFAETLAYPAGRFVRITESVERGGHTIRVTSSFTVATHDLRDEVYAIPLVLSPRGQLEHGVRFMMDGDRRISSLSHAESIAYAASAVRALISASSRTAQRAIADSPPAGLAVATPFVYEPLVAEVSNGSEDKRPLGEAIVAALSSNEPIPQAQRDALIARIISLPASSNRQLLLRAAATIIYALSSQYAICVPVSGSKRDATPRGFFRRQPPQVVPLTSTRVTVERVVVPRPRLRGDAARYAHRHPRLSAQERRRLRGLRGRWSNAQKDSRRRAIRRWRRMRATAFWRRAESLRRSLENTISRALGVPRTTIAYPTSLANSTHSYHLNVRGPERSYVSEQELLPREQSDDGRRLSNRILQQLPYSMATRRGQRTAHLYVRSGRTFNDYEFQAKFAERMPGSMSTAFVGAATALVIAGALAYATLSSASPEAGTFVGLLQILLAFPLALTATSSISTGSPFWGGDLGARVSTMLTVALLAWSLWVSTIAVAANAATTAALWVPALTIGVVNVLFTSITWLTRVSTSHEFGRG